MAQFNECALIPDGDHFAIVRNGPAGGLTYEPFTDRVAWQAEIERLTLTGEPFKGLMVQTAQVKIEVKLDRPPLAGGK